MVKNQDVSGVREAETQEMKAGGSLNGVKGGSVNSCKWGRVSPHL